MQAPKDNKDNTQCSVAKMQLQTSRLDGVGIDVLSFFAMFCHKELK